MSELRSGIQIRAAIVSYYKRACYCYGIPFGFMLMQVLLNTVFNFDFQPFLALAFLSILPFGILGIIFTKRGYALASNSGDREKKDVGYANFLLGIGLLVLGLFGLTLAYMMTN